jgi:hypothetical protein
MIREGGQSIDCHIAGWFIPAPHIATQKASTKLVSAIDIQLQIILIATRSS